ncbi:hypothetical protein Tco_1350055, partial [Tanacetum coccineum]
RKSHLLEDKQIPSVGVFDEVIWEALGGNTRDLDSIWEETGQDYNFTQSDLKNVRTVLGDGVAILSDDVKSYVTASERNHLKETLRRFGKATASGLWRRRHDSIPIYIPTFLGF